MPEIQKNENLPTILYAEDIFDAFLLVKIILKNKYNVVNAKNSNEIFELLESNTIKLILLDIALEQRYDGLEIAKTIKSNPKYKHIPIVALTAYAMKGDKEKILEAGVDDYISKPFNRAELLRKIEKYLN